MSLMDSPRLRGSATSNRCHCRNERRGYARPRGLTGTIGSRIGEVHLASQFPYINTSIRSPIKVPPATHLQPSSRRPFPTPCAQLQLYVGFALIWPSTVNFHVDTGQPPASTGRSIHHRPTTLQSEFCFQYQRVGRCSRDRELYKWGDESSPIGGYKTPDGFGYGPQHSTTMSTTDVYGYTHDFFPDGYYIHPFRGVTYDYSDNEAKEHPRMMSFPLPVQGLAA